MNKNALYLAIFGILCVLAGLLVGVNLTKRPALSWFAPERMSFRERAEHFMGYGLRHPGKTRAEGFVEMLSAKLNLSPEQKEKITKILEDTRLKIDELGKNMRNAITEIKQESDKQIMDILTPQQQEKFKALKRDWGFKRAKEKRMPYRMQPKKESASPQG